MESSEQLTDLVFGEYLLRREVKDLRQWSSLRFCLQILSVANGMGARETYFRRAREGLELLVRRSWDSGRPSDPS